ncbi:membrane-associated protein, putative [Bodo saltans]|uniref:Membrane-associated protein, putative n=1 Tax=Bodo saltans TaxID=75058 RepID=A0A0S4IP18_BODSA|nr:membrane-associated protein, putative [Bodo saltans]|eukprot:CUE87462.1 membrane-associated protein, putative [Bodo saltans]
MVSKAWILGCASVLIVINVVLWMPESTNISRGHSEMEESSIRVGNRSKFTNQPPSSSSSSSAVGDNEDQPIPGKIIVDPLIPLPVEDPIQTLYVGGHEVKPLGTIPMDGRSGLNIDYLPPGVHQVRAVDRAYGVHKIPWALQRATTALAEWFQCVRTLQYFRGLAHPDGTLISPCVGQMKNLSSLPPPKLTPCDPDGSARCSEQQVHIPAGECAYQYLGCVKDSLADERWNIWFQTTFLPVFAVHSRHFLRPGEGVSDDDVKGKGFHIISTCHHVLLTTAPWCGLRTSDFNDWTMDIERGFPPGRNEQLPMLTEQRRKLYVSMSQAAKEPVLPSTLISLSPQNASYALTVGAEVLKSAWKAPHVPRRLLLKNAKKLFTEASNVGRLNSVDAEAISDLHWIPWPTADGSPSPVDYRTIPNETDHNELNETIFYPPVTPSPDAGDLLSAKDFPQESLERSPKHGSVYFQRVRMRYPIIFAARREDAALQTGKRPTRDTMIDEHDKIRGFHVCIFGALRNLSSTVRQIRRRYLDTMRPERIHIITNDVGVKDYSPEVAHIVNAQERLAAARAKLFINYMGITPFAATMLAVPTGLTKKNECLHCRGSFMKELARMSLLSDLQHNYPVEIVFVFRPDSFPLLPIHLIPFFPEDQKLHVQGSLMGYHPHDRTPHQAAKTASASGTEDAVPDADVIQYRLVASDYPFTIVRDRGFVPTHFGYINDINITKYTVVFHTRVTLGLDFGWTGDPVLFGHWNVVNHWLQHFSTTMGSATDMWEERQPGEKHQYRFYSRFVQPLFKLGVEAGALTHALDMRIFDFMFSLYRTNPSINYNLFALPTNFAAYQEMTIIRNYPTKYQEGLCKHYRFVPASVNLTQSYGKTSLLTWNGAIGKVVHTALPMEACKRSPTPPGLPTCYPPFERVPLSSRNAFKAPCAPFCGHANLLAIEGICIFTGKTGKHPRTFGKPGMATYSESPISRSHIEGEVQRFNVVFPQSVRRRNISDLLP